MNEWMAHIIFWQRYLHLGFQSVVVKSLIELVLSLIFLFYVKNGIDNQLDITRPRWTRPSAVLFLVLGF